MLLHLKLIYIYVHPLETIPRAAITRHGDAQSGIPLTIRR